MLASRGIRHVVFEEPDLGDQATSLATEPLMDEKRRLLGRWPLWRGA